MTACSRDRNTVITEVGIEKILDLQFSYAQHLVVIPVLAHAHIRVPGIDFCNLGSFGIKQVGLRRFMRCLPPGHIGLEGSVILCKKAKPPTEH